MSGGIKIIAYKELGIQHISTANELHKHQMIRHCNMHNLIIVNYGNIST